MHFLKFALTPFLLSLAWNAHALQKCVAPDGSVSYVDVCPTGTQRAPSKTDPQLIPKPSGTLPRKPAAEPAPVAPAVQPRTAAPRPPKPMQLKVGDVSLEFYDVEAASFSAARSAAAARPTGPVQAAWRLGFEYKVKQAGGGRCALDTLSTKLDLVLTLPRWMAPPGTPEDEMELWRDYVDALRIGEDPRLEHARAFERALPGDLLALPAADTCAALEAAMRSRYETLRAQTQARFSDHR
ncbi:MAG TPA: DUF922 domain-containing protein [Burkholderiales bacterium]|nr:DUF922 domain-containing protein [Burkholderiales bacterium]